MEHESETKIKCPQIVGNLLGKLERMKLLDMYEIVLSWIEICLNVRTGDDVRYVK